MPVCIRWRNAPSPQPSPGAPGEGARGIYRRSALIKGSRLPPVPPDRRAVRVGFHPGLARVPPVVLSGSAFSIAAGHFSSPSGVVVTPSSSSEVWASRLSPTSLCPADLTEGFTSLLPGWADATASGLDLVPTATTVVRFGSPLPARWLRSCVAALRPSSVLSYLIPIVCSGSPSSSRLISSTPCISVWSVFDTSYFHIPNRPRE